jgi:hypothetical protein
MATAPQIAMNMPQEAAPNPFSDPKTIAVYDQMRQSVSPKEFGDEMLAGAAQTAPEDVAAFRSALEQIDLPPEALDLLNNMVDEILANPDKYEEIRAKYKEMGAPDEILPEQFDAEFFSALNMAVDQMIGEPAGVQAFAKGGIAELKPIAKAIASYGRNGDTMLAHITPAEARMLRRRGGSGTINPKTGLPEYFGLFKVVSKSLKAIGKAVKSFAKSSIGKIVLPIALGFFLGPAAAAFVGVGATSVAGIAIAGFIGGAGSTLLAGGNLKSALKAGAIGGLTAGAIAGVSGASFTGTPSGLTPGQAFSGQVDSFTKAITPTASGIQPPTIDASGQARGLSPVPSVEPYPAIRPDEFGIDAQTYADSRAINNRPFVEAPPGQEQVFNNPAYEAKRVSLVPDAQGNLQVPAGQTVGQTTLPGGQILTQNVPISDATQFPGSFDKTGVLTPPIQTTPYTAPTLGESFSKMGEGLGMGDGPASFDTFKQGASDLFSPGPTSEQVTARAKDILGADTTGKMTYADALKAANAEGPGFMRTYGPGTAAGIAALGAFGGFKPSNLAPSAMKAEMMKPATQRIAEQGQQRQYYIQNLPGVKYDKYGAPVNTNPLSVFNTGLGVTSLLPQGYAEGGSVTDLYRKVLGREPDPEGLAHWTKDFGSTVDEGEKARFMQSVNQVLATDPSKTATLAPNIQAVNDAYASIGRTGIGTGANQIDQQGRDFFLEEIASGRANAGTLANKFNTTVDSYLTQKPGDKYSSQVIFDDIVKNAYGGIGRTGFGTDIKQIDPGGYSFWMDALNSGTFTDAKGKLDVAKFNASFNNTVNQYMLEKPNDPLTKYVSTFKPVNVTSKYLTNTNGIVGSPTGTDSSSGIGSLAPVNMPTAYANINAGLSYDAPAGQAAPAIASRQATFAPTMTKLSNAQTAINKALTPPVATTPSVPPPSYNTAPFKVTGPTSITAPVQTAVAASPVIQDPRVVAATKATTPAPLNMGGIASLRSGGYPRKTGQINGPGTATSDSIPAMLSDGEFVMTAKAVRGAGKGDRRAGAKRMYALMNQLEQNAARG